MKYEGNIYRPPSEAYSLIVQATIGCSHDKCTFCSMYKDKKFRIRPVEDVIADLREARNLYREVRRIFLADGNALVLGIKNLLTILSEIRTLFPECERVTVYGSPADALRKTPEELKALRGSGLSMVYIGAESGDDDILAGVKKGANSDEIIASVRKLEEAGIQASVTFISGLGGSDLSERHAIGCARIITESRPSFAALLTLLLEPAAPMSKDLEEGRFSFMTPGQIAGETILLLDLARPKTDCVFRSNHASNYISLKGILPHDNDRLILGLESAVRDGAFKDDYFRLL